MIIVWLYVQLGQFLIFNKDPQNSVTLPDYQDAGKMMSALVRTRRACRRYLNKDVDQKNYKRINGEYSICTNWWQ